MAADTREHLPGAEASSRSGAAPRLYQRACEILAAQIEAGQLPAGSRLRESRIAREFGISRAPARQALAELARRGLVVKADGRGYTVRPLPRPKAAPKSAKSPGERIPLVSSASWERIYAEVEDELIARISFASWRVKEVELARHYHVSRTVARDVVARLHQRGLVRKDDSARWYAPALTPQHVGELYELRWLLEPTALAKAAPQVPAGFIAQMRRNLEEAIANAREIGGATLDRLEQEMHVTLLEHCGNRTLMQAITMPQSLLVAHRFLYRWTPRLFETEPFLPEHLEIVGHLEAGRVEAAARALQRHLKVSRKRAIARIDVIVRAFDPEELPYLERHEPG